MADASLAERLARAITLDGPIPVAHYMAAANTHYYATRDAIGKDGDFTTAPEISQMFGELIGAWLADMWTRAGKPKAAYVELGPGRGTLAVDALRAMAIAGLDPEVHLVETSPKLRALQKERLPAAIWHDDLSTLPGDVALLGVANEFFDALPIRQLIRTGEGWHERVIACQQTLFVPILGKPVPDGLIPPKLHKAPAGSILETSPAGVNVMRRLAGWLAAQGGATIVIDYGYQGPAVGDTLQAVHAHHFVNPFASPGDNDLTAHVDFATLAAAAKTEGAKPFGPVDQGRFLINLGIDARAATLIAAAPDRAGQIEADRKRLVSPAAMGRLFKAMALTGGGWPKPVGLA